MASNTPSRHILRSTHPPNGARTMPRAASRAKRSRSVRGTGSSSPAPAVLSVQFRLVATSTRWSTILSRCSRQPAGPQAFICVDPRSAAAAVDGTLAKRPRDQLVNAVTHARQQSQLGQGEDGPVHGELLAAFSSRRHPLSTSAILERRNRCHTSRNLTARRRASAISRSARACTIAASAAGSTSDAIASQTATTSARQSDCLETPVKLGGKPLGELAKELIATRPSMDVVPLGHAAQSR